MGLFVFCQLLILFTCNLFLSRFRFVTPSTMEKIASEFADDDARVCEVSVESSSAKSITACTKCLCEIESPMMTFRM
jgi:hypothetical protein